MDNELLPCQKSLLLLFELIPSKMSGTAGIFIGAFKAQSKTMYKALETDKRLQAEIDTLFIRARDELNKIYPDQV